MAGSDFRHQRGRHRARRDRARRPDAAERSDRNDDGDDQGASHRQASSPGVAGSGASLPAKSALRTPIATGASASGSKSGSTAIRLKRPATKVKKNRAPKRESSCGDADAGRFRRVHEFLDSRQHVGVDLARVIAATLRIAAGLGPDLDDQARLFGRFGEDVSAQAGARSPRMMSPLSAMSSANAWARPA